jgi:pyruvate dehydrogenase E2 component (dihydrolipoamide acetyltransferase)
VNVKLETVTVPDLGGATDVEVIELNVAVGDAVTAEQPLLTLESDKASMEIPAPFAGTVRELRLKVGDKVNLGDAILVLEVAGAEASQSVAAPATAAAVPAQQPAAEAPSPATTPVAERRATPVTTPPAAAGVDMDVLVPDLGGAASVEVIEISVRAGDRVAEGAPLLVMEGDKASMELPAPV